MDPSWDAVAEAVGKAHGRKMSAARVKWITNPPMVVSGDAPQADHSEELWNVESLLVPSPEDIVVDESNKQETILQVRSALVQECTSALELAIVEHRLTCAPADRLSHKDLAKLCLVSAPEVSRVEKSFVARLRTLLS